jgi:hypothetical protein
LQASDTEIKGRVIKKARRRNPVGGEEGQEKKSAFASFGGFTSAAAPPPAAAADAFSFLAKSPSTTSSETKKPETGTSKLCSNMLNVCSSFGITVHCTLSSVPVPLHSLLQLCFQEKNVSMTNDLVFLPCPVPTFPVSSKLRWSTKQCFGSRFIDSGSGFRVSMTKNCKKNITA